MVFRAKHLKKLYKHKNGLFNGAFNFSYTDQMIKIGGGGGDQIFQRDHLFLLNKGGPNFSKGDRFFLKIMVPPDHFFPEIFGPGGGGGGDFFGGDQLLRDSSR